MKAEDVEKLVEEYNLGKIKATIDMAMMSMSNGRNKDKLRIVLASQQTYIWGLDKILSVFGELIGEFDKAIGKDYVKPNKSDNNNNNVIYISGFKAEAWPRVRKLLKRLDIPYGLDGNMMKEKYKDYYFTKEARIEYLGFKD